MIRGGPSIVKDGLIWYLDPADRNSYVSGSTTIYNLIGDWGHGTITNFPFNYNNCGCFLGNSSGYVNCGSHSMFSFSGSQFTFGGWFYFDGTSQNDGILSHRNDTPYNQWGIGVNADATMGGNGTKLAAFVCSDGGGPTYYCDFNYELSTSGSGWYYGMVAVDTTVQRMYCNGRNVLTNTINYTGRSFLIPNRYTFYGAQNAFNAANVPWKTYISLVHLYNRTLTSGEILQNYNATKGRFGRLV